MLLTSPTAGHASRARGWGHPHQTGRPAHCSPNRALVRACCTIIKASSSSSTSTKANVKQALTNFMMELPTGWHDVPPGSTVVIRPLARQWHDSTANLLSDAFVEAAGFQSYRKLLNRNILSYLDSQVNLIPQAVILTAFLRSNTPIEPPQESDWLDSSQHSTDLTSSQSESDAEDGGTPAQPPVQETLLGTVEVSFDRSTHSTYIALNPPTRCGYLCNMAVSPDWRRRGVGMMLIQAVEQACAIAGETELYLHLRVKDVGAAALYDAAGFTQVAADWWLLSAILRQEPKRLMKKVLRKDKS